MSSNEWEQARAYVEKLRQQGRTDEEIRQVMLKGGWTEEQVEKLKAQEAPQAPAAPQQAEPEGCGRVALACAAGFCAWFLTAVFLGGVFGSMRSVPEGVSGFLLWLVMGASAALGVAAVAPWRRRAAGVPLLVLLQFVGAIAYATVLASGDYSAPGAVTGGLAGFLLGIVVLVMYDPRLPASRRRTRVGVIGAALLIAMVAVPLWWSARLQRAERVAPAVVEAWLHEDVLTLDGSIDWQELQWDDLWFPAVSLTGTMSDPGCEIEVTLDDRSLPSGGGEASAEGLKLFWAELWVPLPPYLAKTRPSGQTLTAIGFKPELAIHLRALGDRAARLGGEYRGISYGVEASSDIHMTSNYWDPNRKYIHISWCSGTRQASD